MNILKQERKQFEVRNFDINGNLIPDISKVDLPEDIQNFIIQIKLKSAERKRKEISKC